MATGAIVGRPNVGKSTLFNRLVGKHLALVDGTAGVTRDRHYSEVEWLGHVFRLIDTGGIDTTSQSALIQAVCAQTEAAIAEADFILFVVDVRTGVTAADEEIATTLRKGGREVFLVGNKAEAAIPTLATAPLYRLGFGQMFLLSAEHGQGVGDLLDAINATLPSRIPLYTPADVDSVRVALVGRPNVGKSSLVNCLLGEERLLVDSTPGTTRDAIDSQVRFHKRLYTLVDTAGMRKPRRIDVELEKATVANALKSIKHCDVALLVLDAVVGVHEQDARIATHIEHEGKACVVVLNKWDILEKTSHTYENIVQSIHDTMPFLAHAPIISVSALTRQRVVKLFPLIDTVFAESKRRVTTSQLNAFLKTVTLRRPAPTYRGRQVKFSFLMQVAIQPPTFLCFVNYPQGVAQYYQRYLANQIRQHFGFSGTPMRLFFRQK